MQAFASTSGWFSLFKECSGFHNVKVSRELANGDVGVTKKFLEWQKNVMMKG
jgi:hypothetical protein